MKADIYRPLYQKERTGVKIPKEGRAAILLLEWFSEMGICDCKFSDHGKFIAAEFEDKPGMYASTIQFVNNNL